MIHPPLPEPIVQSVRERADLHLAERGREVLVMDMSDDEYQAHNFHWATVRFNHEPDSPQFQEAVLMLRVLRDMREVALAQRRLEEALGRL